MVDAQATATPAVQINSINPRSKVLFPVDQLLHTGAKSVPTLQAGYHNLAAAEEADG
jgi:hypothetical protein